MESEVGAIIGGNSGSSDEEDDEVANFLLPPPGRLKVKKSKFGEKLHAWGCSAHTNHLDRIEVVSESQSKPEDEVKGNQEQAQSKESEENNQNQDIEKNDQANSFSWTTKIDNNSVEITLDDPVVKDMEI